MFFLVETIELSSCLGENLWKDDFRCPPSLNWTWFSGGLPAETEDLPDKPSVLESNRVVSLRSCRRLVPSLRMAACWKWGTMGHPFHGLTFSGISWHLASENRISVHFQLKILEVQCLVAQQLREFMSMSQRSSKLSGPIPSFVLSAACASQRPTLGSSPEHGRFEWEKRLNNMDSHHYALIFRCQR